MFPWSSHSSIRVSLARVHQAPRRLNMALLTEGGLYAASPSINMALLPESDAHN